MSGQWIVSRLAAYRPKTSWDANDASRLLTELITTRKTMYTIQSNGGVRRRKRGELRFSETTVQLPTANEKIRVGKGFTIPEIGQKMPTAARLTAEIIA
jgi:hypothetical protein